MKFLGIRIPDELHKRIKHEAIEKNLTIQDMVTELLDKLFKQK
jgi:predicted DNA binding CopG/RHH family protein